MSSLTKTQEDQKHLVANRYNRQELIKGWNQGKIRKAHIAVVGAGSLANFTSASLVSLGFGNINLYDNARVEGSYDGEFLLSLEKARRGNSKVEVLEKILSKTNPLVKVRGIHARIDSIPLTELLGKPEVIVDTTNDPKSKNVISEYAKEKKVPIISASTNLRKGQVYIKLPGKDGTFGSLEHYEGRQQGAIPSEVLGGIITEEARKIVMPLSKEDIPVRSLVYSLISPQRFSDKEELETLEASLKDKHVLVVGAGALGNFAGVGLALAGIGKIDILDFDTIETTNLNRQLLFYDSVGQKKTEALSAKLKFINPDIKVRGLDGKLDESYANHFRLRKNRPDLILDCVDNFSTRAIVNYFAVKYGIPLVSGGTNHYSGQVVVYKPGESACLDCKLNVDKALAKERTSHSCIYASQPSVIMTNEIIGGLMVGEARAVLDSEHYGIPIKKMLKYDSTNPTRGGLVGSEEACDCSRPGMKQWLKQIDKKAK